MQIREVTIDELSEALQGGSRVVDVREPDEFEAGHVPGASLIPLGTVPMNTDPFMGDGTTYVVCRSGVRSMQACEYVAAQGADVANVAGGMLAWVASGREVETGSA